MARILPDRDQINQVGGLKRPFSSILIKNLLDTHRVPGWSRTPCRFSPLNHPHHRFSPLFHPHLKVPQLSLMRHNDLTHLADTLLLLPTCFRPELDTLLQSNADSRRRDGDGEESGPGTSAAEGGKTSKGLSFVTDALVLRQAAEEVMKQQVCAADRRPRLLECIA